MSRLVVFKIGEGTFTQGFSVTLEIGKETGRPAVQVSGELPGSPKIPPLSQQWQTMYRGLGLGDRLEANTGQTVSFSVQESCDALKTSINAWLNSDGFRSLKKQSLKELLLKELSPSDEIRFIIQTDNIYLRRIPWKLWEFFDNYPKAEVALSPISYQLTPYSQQQTEKVRILAILGDSKGIDTETDRKFLENLSNAETVFLVEPRREELNEKLWDKQGWDILCFSGHSSSQPDGQSGHIRLNAHDSLTLDELRYATRKAIERGLQLAIFNSCDGLGIAKDLTELTLPQIIVMREPVPDIVAQEFLKRFLGTFSQGQSLYLSVREAREWLQGIEYKYPCASWLPVIYQNLAVIPPRWDSFGASQATKKQTKIFISYSMQEPDKDLAWQFYQGLTQAGHQPFLAGESIRLGENWVKRIETELQQCDYLLLFLSEQSVTSEMVTKEIQKVKEIQQSRSDGKPIILPIRINFPLSTPLNYEQRGYLDLIQQREWNCPEDTNQILQEILEVLKTGKISKDASTLSVSFPIQEKQNAPPLPTAEPEFPAGQVPLDSDFYIRRDPEEGRCYQEILKPGSLIRIKAPRQMGKTSLMARILYSAREQGYQTIPLSFQLADKQLFSDLDAFLRWFCERVGRKLKKLHQLDEYWSGYGSKDKCTEYFEDCLLEDLEQPLVLGLDEVDRIFSYREIADDFFSLLRGWYEASRYGDLTSELWKKLRLVVVHSTEVYIPLDINQSPFNVGLPIELQEFKSVQVEELANRYGLNLSKKQLEVLMNLVGGHPYLVRLALYHLKQQDITLETLKQTAPTEAGIYNDHLRRHLWTLQENSQLAAGFYQAVTTPQAVELESDLEFKLHSLGLVHRHENGVSPRCALYKVYFSERLRTIQEQ